MKVPYPSVSTTYIGQYSAYLPIVHPLTTAPFPPCKCNIWICAVDSPVHSDVNPSSGVNRPERSTGFVAGAAHKRIEAAETAAEELGRSKGWKYTKQGEETLKWRCMVLFWCIPTGQLGRGTAVSMALAVTLHPPHPPYQYVA
ncbi:hypothetical protein TEQG_01244 [Trichophyton equinum CBS 127.97]|uniref:Uncharacterized protein n=1 Tax=Trichophyton equinum (strain ATCC MYA-4606 / CBS 127.97) TaxID=559882 RepID=F2PJY6_TRIEC|nr:hypothetical protein TEQG_01244 [Trichophyton equinum CBS 127.97]